MNVFADMVIAHRVRAALQQNQLINRSDIDVIVSDGAVALSGRVDSYFDSLHAQEIAAAVSGVTRVRNRLGIKNLAGDKTDGEISEAIQTQFWHSPMVYVEEAAVSVKDGVATLNGVVRSFEEFESARQKAYEAGAKRVENYLEVRE